MDVLLVNSIEFLDGNHRPQMGQMILRKILRKKYITDYVNFDELNYNKKLEFRTTFRENVEMFADYIVEKSPKVVGFYTIADSFVITAMIAKRVKERNQNIKIVFGGPHATLVAKECLEALIFVDVISLGEGELTILPLMEALIEGKSLDGLNGIAYRKDGIIIEKKNMELVPASDLELYAERDYSPYTFNHNEVVSIEAGRGCPFGCAFCSTSVFWKRKFRVKPVEALVKEIVDYCARYGTKKYNLEHDMLTADREYMFRLCDELQRLQEDIVWTCSARVDCLDKELLEKMKAARCKSIYLGIETGSPRMQKIENKNLDLNRALETIGIINKLNIGMTISFIYGFPEETVEDVEKTLKMMDMLVSMGVGNLQLHRYMVLPATPDLCKVENELYLDESIVSEMPVIYRNIFNDDEVKQMVLNNKQIFIQYYTFDTDVRMKYKYLDLLLVVYVTMKQSGYSWSIRELICCFGFNTIYNACEDILEKFLGCTEDSEKRTATIGIRESKFAIFNCGKEIFNRMLKQVDNQLIKEIYDFESMISRIKRGEIFEETRSYFYDVYSGTKSGIFEKNKTYVKFVAKSDKHTVSKIRMDKGDEENEKVFIAK